jgi:hypothetical protein
MPITIMIGLDQCIFRNPATSPYNPFPMASDIFHSSFTKPISFFFFRYRKNPFHETHEKAQNPKGQQRASHSDNDHGDSKCPIVHIHSPPNGPKIKQPPYITPKKEFQ